MGRITRRPAARKDLIDIYKYIARDAPLRAGPFLKRINEKLVTLSNHPLMGTASLPGYPDVRIFPAGNYLIIYRPLPDGGGIELIRIYHRARDWEVLIGADLT
jgi:toxin ParE1/3/4